MINKFFEVFAHVRDCYQNYFGGSGFGILFVSCLLYIHIGKKKQKTSSSGFFFWTMFVLLAVLFCPATAWIIGKLIGEEVYWRVFWLLPVIPTAAYAGTELLSEIGDKQKSCLAGLLIAAVLVMNGTFVFQEDYFTARENNYKLPTEVIWVADAINEHAAENRIKKRIVAPNSINTYIRVYDASIRQKFGRYTTDHPAAQGELYRLINADEPDLDELAQLAADKKQRYIVLCKYTDDREIMERNDFSCIYESEAYVVYFNERYRH